MVKLVEIYNNFNGQYHLREIYINPKHVVAMRSDEKAATIKKDLPDDLDERQSFTKLYLNRGQVGIDITVVGDLQSITEKLGLPNRSLLKG